VSTRHRDYGRTSYGLFTHFVYDIHMDQAQNIAIINNQVQQIQTLTDPLNEFKHYEDPFGDSIR
jgi:hypothetical protein